MIVVDGCRRQLERYLHAKSKFEESEASGVTEQREAPTAKHNTDDGSAEEHASVFKQPANESESMPHMGSGVSTKELSDNSEVDGLGSRRVDARGIRSASLMATTSLTTIAKSR
jgi:hypothetical protein